MSDLRKSMMALYLAADADIVEHHNKLTLEALEAKDTEISRLCEALEKYKEALNKVINSEDGDWDFSAWVCKEALDKVAALMGGK